MTTRTEKQKEARELRLKGHTITEIEKMIDCPRGSIHYWTKDLVLSSDGEARLETQKQKNRENKTVRLDKQQLEQLIEEDCTIQEMTERLNSSSGVIRRHLREYKLKASKPLVSNTKNKGDRGVGFVIASLMAQDIHVALPISEHLPFDMIAIKENSLSRLSVKHARCRNGVISTVNAHVWGGKESTHYEPTDKRTFDATAIYCPDTGKCYYVKNEETIGNSIRLRVEKTKNGQEANIRFASDYENPDRLFE